MSYHERTANAARGKWRGILLSLGVQESFLRDKHGPCPFCGGVDRYRFDDKEGRGSFICSQCGAGGGLDFVMRFTGLQFPEAAARVDEIIRNVKPGTDKPKREMTDDERRAMLNAAWREALVPEPGDLLHRYLAARGIPEVPPGVRFARAMRDGEGGIRPAMVAMVVDAEGRPCTLHRTFLRPDGLAKAEMASPRKLMPGPIPDGACIRLSEVASAICVAEGIETALAATELFEVPCWATITAGMMAKWVAPKGVESVTICADHDASFTGHAAAYALARRLHAAGIEVNVRVPDAPGSDWNDVLLSRKAAA